MGKMTRTAPLRGSPRKKRPVILMKPYGFCCMPERQPSEAEESVDLMDKKRSPPPASTLSLGSLHECPALRLRLEVTSKRPKVAYTPDGRRIAVDSGDADPGGLLDDTTQSSIDLMIELMRKQRQDEYERQMDLWAELGEKKVHDRVKRIKCFGRPYWYAEYSLEQLRLLKQLEDVLIKDKKQKSINRTKCSLEALGAINEVKKVEPKVLAKLIREYSTEPIKFLCEIYKATTGLYPGQEDYSCTYDPSMRIIMSGIAFLELPDIIVELHKILPPIIKYPPPPKPVRPKAIYPKKPYHPLLQKIELPPNNRLYKQKAIEWEKKCRDMRRPLVILPKKNELEQLAQQKQGDGKLPENKTTNNDKKPEPLKKEEEKRASVLSKISRASRYSKASRNSKASKISAIEEEEDGVEDEYEDEVEYEDLSNDGEEEFEEEQSRQTVSPFQMRQIEWTTPPSPCPYKYQKLMNEQGPLKENEAFFSALRPAQRVRDFPSGRENLTMGLQTYLLDVEADMHPLQAKASELLAEVGRLAQEILESGPKCDGCCPCRQTRRSHLIWHATQGPHNVIDGVTLDDHGRGQKQVIGSTVLHTPASSVSSNSEPPRVPSQERMMKERVLGGFIIDEDGQPVRHVEAVSKMPDHVPQRELRPDADVEVIRNVPPCGCNEQRKHKGEEPQTEIDLTELSRGKDEGLCYGAKFRPREGPNYQCGVNNPLEVVGCRCTRQDPLDNPNDDCVCDDFLSRPPDVESYECEESIGFSCNFDGSDSPANKKQSFKFCLPCGKKVYPCRAGKPAESKDKLMSTCSCDSLSEFLQLDLCKVKCEKPPKESYEKRIEKKETNASRSQTSKKEETPSERRRKSDVRKSINKEKQEEEIETETLDERRSSRRRSSMKNGENSDSSDKNGTSEKPEVPDKPEKSRKSEKTKKLDKPRKSSKLEKPSKLPQLDDAKTSEDAEPPPKAPDDKGPPYADRTKSEEALPTELTIAYLVDRHPPDFATEQVPVREGGRPCRCRENRNNRKKLIFGIGNTTAGDPTSAVIEGVAWLTPVPSIRRSEEYIPEYEVYDSPYGCKVCGAGRPARKSPSDAKKIRKQRTDRPDCVLVEEIDDDEGEGEEEVAATESSTSTETEVILDRSKDWNNAMKDEYLSEFYAKKPSRIPCWKRCARDSEPPRLKVMKPVCECRYERKIVKREEERRRWRERKKRLQSLPKEEFLHLKDVAMLPIERDEDEEPPPRCCCVPPLPTEEPVQVVEGITVQTPCDTPTHSRSCVFPNLPFKPDCNREVQRKGMPLDSEISPSDESAKKKLDVAAITKGKKRKSSESKKTTTKEKAPDQRGKVQEEKVEPKKPAPEQSKIEKPAPEKVKTEGTALEKAKSDKSSPDKAKTDKPSPDKSKSEMPMPEKAKTDSPSIEVSSEVEIQVPKRRRRTSYLNRLEEELMTTVRNSLAKIGNNDLVSVKFPDYDKMPQLAYWISYRVKGMNFTRNYKYSLLMASIKSWESKKMKSNPILAPSIKVTKKNKEKLHFGYVRYWKQKIAKMKLNFYMNVRKQIVDLGRDQWFSMEFGKFPNVLFKQAYFTYLPTKEIDTVAFRPWFPS